MLNAFRLQASKQTLAGLYERLLRAYAMGQQRLVRHIHALLTKSRFTPMAGMPCGCFAPKTSCSHLSMSLS